MLLHSSVFMLNLIFSLEFFSLVAALFLWAYVAKNQLSKWLRYGAITSTVMMVLIILCTLVNGLFACCRHHGDGHGCPAKCRMWQGCGYHDDKGEHAYQKKCPHTHEHEEEGKHETTDSTHSE